MRSQTWPIPDFFDPSRVGKVWRIPYGERAIQAEAWAQEQGIRPASEDPVRVGLLIIDCQNTFCIPEFELFVAGRSGLGAVEDNVRLCEFIYRNLGRITEILPTMDTHRAIQIFHPLFWVDGKGAHPVGGQTIITPEDLDQGRWKVNPAIAGSIPGRTLADLERHARHYVQTLTSGGKYPLMVWPYHAMLGGIGHALVSAVEEALFFHCIARVQQTRFETKGLNALTENYSVLRPEIMEDPEGKPIAESNQALIDTLLAFDALIVAGQAKSHCVAWTLDDLLTEIESRDPALAGRIYLLEDCTSPVVVPGVVDFTEQEAAAFERFVQAGMHLVRSSEPVSNWPEFPSD